MSSSTLTTEKKFTFENLVSAVRNASLNHAEFVELHRETNLNDEEETRMLRLIHHLRPRVIMLL